MKRALAELGWRGLTLLGAFVGLLMGLAIAPELPAWAPWVLGLGIAAVFIAVLLRQRFREPDERPH